MQFLLACVFFLIGMFAFYFPPKSINELYGYRTKNSMSSPEKWTLAQKYSSQLMIKLGLMQICCSFFGVFFENSKALHLSVGTLSAVLTCVILITFTENKLKREFPDNKTLGN